MEDSAPSSGDTRPCLRGLGGGGNVTWLFPGDASLVFRSPQLLSGVASESWWWAWGMIKEEEKQKDNKEGDVCYNWVAVKI